MNIGYGKQNIAHVTKNNESDLATFFCPKIIKSSFIMDNVYANTINTTHMVQWCREWILIYALLNNLLYYYFHLCDNTKSVYIQ